MNISGVGNIGIYSSHGSGESSSTIRSQASFSDSYSGSVNASLPSYDMFGNIRSNIFDSFLKEDSFKQAIQDVFEGIEEKIIDTDTLVEAAKYSDTFSKFGEEIHVVDKKLAVLIGAKNVYFDASKESLVSVNDSENIVIEAESGDRQVAMRNNRNTIVSLGTGNDHVSGGANNNSIISTGTGDDTISNIGDTNSIINAGAGNDRINSLRSSNMIIDAGSGNDSSSILDSDNVILNMANGDDSAFVSGSDNIIVNTGAGNDSTSVVDSQNVLIDAGDGNDSINVISSDNSSVNGGIGNDSLRLLDSENSLINMGSGEDYVIVSNSTNVNAQLGDGNDVLKGSGDSMIVDGGAGDDSINVSGSGLLISGGTGNDFISIKTGTNKDAAANTITYNLGDGMDTIDTHGGTNTINMNNINYEDVDIAQESDDYGNYTVNIMLKDGSGGITLNAGSNADNSISFADQTISL
jgi:Ca2+-binding RTX toxin-like protein